MYVALKKKKIFHICESVMMLYIVFDYCMNIGCQESLVVSFHSVGRQASTKWSARARCGATPLGTSAATPTPPGTYCSLFSNMDLEQIYVCSIYMKHFSFMLHAPCFFTRVRYNYFNIFCNLKKL
jgi:hypothetical protein